MLNTQTNYKQLIEKWNPILGHKDVPSIKDSWRTSVTAQLLENQETFLKEATPTNAVGNAAVDNWDPVLISLVRRAMPNLIAYDICGVQPMTGPTGLIFAMRSRYISQTGTEALHNEPETGFTGTGSGALTGTQATDPTASGFGSGATAARNRYGESNLAADVDFAQAAGPYGTGSAEGDIVAQMGFDIDKVTVTANTRALHASYTTELAQDLRAIHGLEAETELANILSAEILAEINREVVRKINITAKQGCLNGTTTNGVFDLDTDSNGRWSVEKFKGLLFQIERECNVIARETRRGKGNFILTSSDVASALSMAGVLDYTPALQTDLNVDDTGNTFAGTINGRLKVYIDPYFEGSAGSNYFTVGYKGANQYDAGLFYCPYVPLQMVRAVDESSFQPKIAFKTRYGLVSNPYVEQSGGDGSGAIRPNENQYYRISRVDNLM